MIINSLKNFRQEDLYNLISKNILRTHKICKILYLIKNINLCQIHTHIQHYKILKFFNYHYKGVSKF